MEGKVNEALYQRGRADFFAHRYTYDADNRLTHARTSGDGVFWDLDGRYFYYPHGPLARLEIGQDHVQGQDHFYSVHGWIKGMNMPEGRTSNALADPGLDGEQTTSGNIDRHAARDAAAFHLGFYQGDYQAIGTVSMGSADSAWTALTPDILALPGQAQGLYNGNIAMMVTDLKVVPATTGFIKGAVANADSGLSQAFACSAPAH